MNCVGAFESRIEKVEKLTVAVSNMVQAVTNKLSVSSKNLKAVNDKVSLNKDNITVLENSVKILSEKKDEQPASYSSSQLPPGDNGSLLAEAMMKQACFHTAIQLGQSPTMVFWGELHKYVQFITMFRNSFDNTINDPVALYEKLMRHVKGPAKSAIEPSILSTSSVNHYEEAMTILKMRYGQKMA